MTIKIEIEAHPDRGDMGQQVERAMSALGFSRQPLRLAEALSAVKEAGGELRAEPAASAEDAVAKTEAEIETVSGVAETIVERPDAPAAEQTATQIDTRPVGSPSEGNKRRNSAEKAEDDELEALAASKGISLDDLNKAIGDAGREIAKRELEAFAGRPDGKAEEKPAISTGEERIGPDDEQDAADEAAETAKTGLAPIDVLRRLVGDYQKKHGMPKAVALCQEGGLIGKPIHELDDAGIEAAIAAMSGGVDTVEAAEEKPEPAKLAPKTKGDLVEAMMRYADKFDGTRDQAKMKATLEDMPKVFAKTFGADVTKLSQVPEDRYAEAVAAVEAAIEADPFGRAK